MDVFTRRIIACPALDVIAQAVFPNNDSIHSTPLPFMVDGFDRPILVCLHWGGRSREDGRVVYNLNGHVDNPFHEIKINDLDPQRNSGWMESNLFR